MGGFGAYDLALKNPRAFCAVGGDSAALWRSGGETASGAFDNAEDFSRNDVIAGARSGGDAYAATSLWFDVGGEDPFRSAATELAGLLEADGRNVQFHVWSGGHAPAYWDTHWGSYLRFYEALWRIVSVHERSCLASAQLRTWANCRARHLLKCWDRAADDVVLEPFTHKTGRMNAGGLIAVGALVLGFLPVTGAMAAGENLIYNPAFGQGLRGWKTAVVAHGSDPMYPRVVALKRPSEPMLKCERAQRRRSFLQMNVSDGATAYIEQSIVVPVSPGRLTFRTWGGLEPVKATVSIVDGSRVRRLVSYSPPTLQATSTSCSGARPAVESLNLTPYAGEAVGIRIQATSPLATSQPPATSQPARPAPAAGTMAIADFSNFELAAR